MQTLLTLIINSILDAMVVCALDILIVGQKRSKQVHVANLKMQNALTSIPPKATFAQVKVAAKMGHILMLGAIYLVIKQVVIPLLTFNLTAPIQQSNETLAYHMGKVALFKSLQIVAILT